MDYWSTAAEAGGLGVNAGVRGLGDGDSGSGGGVLAAEVGGGDPMRTMEE